MGFGTFWLLEQVEIGMVFAVIFSLIAAFLVSIVIGGFITELAMSPLHVLWQGIVHVASNSPSSAAPRTQQLRLGRELVSTTLSQIYELGSASKNGSNGGEEKRSAIVQSANIVSHMPLPLFVFNKDLLVTNASDIGLTYCNLESSQLFGKKLDESMNIEFPSEETLDTWIADCIDNKVTDTGHWERVRIVIPGKTSTYKRCDIAAYYNKDNPSGTEFIVTMFDRSERYQQDDSSMSFMALAVHELRTPLTMLRGYIEVLVDELEPTVSDEHKEFLKKMDLSAKQLNAFVGNILNVSRVDENALVLHLTKADWKSELSEIVEQLRPKAEVHGKKIELLIADKLPEVGIDKISMTEVVGNLLDNAIKYSGEQKRIVISTDLGQNGLVETTVQDFGVGIPASVVPHVFEKFYRNHRTKGQVGGSGLGLYLSKALVSAHGGQIWVSSKVDEGSTFGFSLLPYEQLAAEQKRTGNDAFTRNADGWIKNHSLYRR